MEPSTCIRHSTSALRRTLGLLALGLALTACGSSDLPTTAVFPVQSDELSEEDREHLRHLAARGRSLTLTGSRDGALDPARTNELATRYHRQTEADFYASDPQVRERLISALGFSPGRPWPDDLPKLCVALSGGGLRAAAVGMGAVQGIADLDPRALAGVDAISAVSGGSYTLSWLYYQAYHFARYHPAQHCGEGSCADGAARLGEILDPEGPWVNHVETEASGFGDKTMHLVMAPFYVFSQLILAPGKLMSGTPHVDAPAIGYYVDILNTFHTPPGENGVIKMPLLDLGQVVADHELPLPVIGVTSVGLRESCQLEALESRPLSSSLFEITPLRAGADDLGFTDYFFVDEFSDLTGAVISSGAALDHPRSALCLLQRLLGVNIGTSFRNLQLSDWVAPEGGRPVDREVTDKIDVRLVDGGFVDNLAVVPLVRRGCQNILVVDSGYDPALRHCQYRELRRRLREERGLTFELDGSDGIADGVCEGRAKKEILAKGFEADKVEDPVYTGTIGPIPYPGMEPLEAEVRLLKLSLDSAGLGRYPSSVADAYEGQEWDRCVKPKKRLKRCGFPHIPTLQQAYSPETYRAYRELGRELLRATVEGGDSGQVDQAGE